MFMKSKINFIMQIIRKHGILNLTYGQSTIVMAHSFKTTIGLGFILESDLLVQMSWSSLI